nr:basic proline-rich protein-like [Anser cygnoides]
MNAPRGQERHPAVAVAPTRPPPPGRGLRGQEPPSPDKGGEPRASPAGAGKEAGLNLRKRSPGTGAPSCHHPEAVPVPSVGSSPGCLPRVALGLRPRLAWDPAAPTVPPGLPAELPLPCQRTSAKSQELCAPAGTALPLRAACWGRKQAQGTPQIFHHHAPEAGWHPRWPQGSPKVSLLTASARAARRQDPPCWRSRSPERPSPSAPAHLGKNPRAGREPSSSDSPSTALPSPHRPVSPRPPPGTAPCRRTPGAAGFRHRFGARQREAAAVSQRRSRDPSGPRNLPPRAGSRPQPSPTLPRTLQAGEEKQGEADRRLPARLRRVSAERRGWEKASFWGKRGSLPWGEGGGAGQPLSENKAAPERRFSRRLRSEPDSEQVA